MQPDKPQLCCFWLAGIVCALGSSSATAATEIPVLQALTVFLWHFSFAAVPEPLRLAICHHFGAVTQRPAVAKLTEIVEQDLGEYEQDVWCAHIEALSSMLWTDKAFTRWVDQSLTGEDHAIVDERAFTMAGRAVHTFFAIHVGADKRQRQPYHQCAVARI